jgi:hypothetical protein
LANELQVHQSFREEPQEWTIRSPTTGEQFTFQRSVDGWIQGRRIAGPMREGKDDLSMRIHAPVSSVQVAKVEVLYAEYEDGSIEGVAAPCVRKSLEEKRAKAAERGTTAAEVMLLLQTEADLGYVPIETVGGQSRESLIRALSRIASQKRCTAAKEAFLQRTDLDDSLRCSFCHKEKGATGKLISSTGDFSRAYICPECVAVCVMILEDDRPELATPGDRVSG